MWSDKAKGSKKSRRRPQKSGLREKPHKGDVIEPILCLLSPVFCPLSSAFCPPVPGVRLARIAGVHES